MVCSKMEVEESEELPPGGGGFSQLYEQDLDKVRGAVVEIKNSVIGSNKLKKTLVEQSALCRLVNLLTDPDVPADIKINILHIISSISRGSEEEVKAIIDKGIVQILLNGLVNTNEKLTEACLLCLMSVVWHEDAQCELITGDPGILSHIISLLDRCIDTKIAVCRILAAGCRIQDQQNLLVAAGAPKAICSVLCIPVGDVQLAGLECLVRMVQYNQTVSKTLEEITAMDGTPLVAQVIEFTGRQYSDDIQLAASRILTFMYRCGSMVNEEHEILYRVLPCLVRTCQKDQNVKNRIVGAETLAHLIEVNVDLQRIAAISNNLIQTVAAYLKWDPDSHVINIEYGKNQKLDEVKSKIAKDLKTAAYKVFASLAANDEEIRKRLIDTEPLVDSVVSSLQESDENVPMAAIRCLHSLSRSVQLLRTTFQDHMVWKPLVSILRSSSSSVESLLLASSIMCNLLLDFSPSKEKILESGAVDLLCQLTHKYDPSLRLNGVWGLMNMSFNADEKIKSQIMTTLGTDQVFRLLSDTDIQVVMKTLGLLRNLLSNDKQHIDYITNKYGKQLMQAVVFILESEKGWEVKEQALCLLANIADGDQSKKLIVENEDMLKKLKTYMVYNNKHLQNAAVACIQNLIWREEEGSFDRQNKLKDIGVFKILHQLLTTSDDTVLFDKVKVALQQISM